MDNNDTKRSRRPTRSPSSAIAKELLGKIEAERAFFDARAAELQRPSSSDCKGFCEEAARLRIALAKALHETEAGLPCGDTLRVALGLLPQQPATQTNPRRTVRR